MPAIEKRLDQSKLMNSRFRYRVTRLLLAFAYAVILQFHSSGRETEQVERTPLALKTFDSVWNELNEHHFDTNFNSLNWNEVREKYRPKAAAARSNAQLRVVIQEMLDLLHVSHLNIVPGEILEDIRGSSTREDSDPNDIEAAPEDSSGTIGLNFRFLEDQAIVTSLDPDGSAFKIGVRTGWIIRQIGQSSPEKIFKKIPKNLGDQKRNFLAWRAVSHRLNGRPGSTVNLQLVDADNQTHEIELTRRLAPGQAVQLGNLPTLYANLTSSYLPEKSARIGYIRFNIWMLPTAIAFNNAMDAHRKDDGLIIDLRGNIGGLVGMLIGSSGHFFKKPGYLGTMVMRDNQLKLIINPRLVDSSGKLVEPFARPVAILVDEITASASEVFAGGMQDLGRARIFGRTSSGQALPAIMEDLPNGDALYHPIADFVAPSGTRFEGRGVVPDQVVPLNRNALLQGRDPVVEAATAWILKASEK